MSTNNNQNYYLGIDLGTTRSSAHWGAIKLGSNHVEPHLLSFDQKVFDGRMERHGLLPSYLYWPLNETKPYVGDFARGQGLQFQPSRVAREVKNHMGDQNWRFYVDKGEYTAAELSGFILKTIFSGIVKLWGFPVLDAVVTVPASFDSDMRKNTVEAAKLAGFKVENADGSPRNILLDEPRAALYDLLNQQTLGQIPRSVIDFSTPQTVLVFDLGWR